MRIRINKISLIGAHREFTLHPGLNIITGSITTGKTTLLRCIRGLLGSKLENFSREARQHINSLGGEVLIGNITYEVIRPFVTTGNAMVAIASDRENQRLAALRDRSGEQTYGDWLLKKLNLPVLRVPTAPTQDDSDTSPLSINDYMMYCYLRQDEIDSSVFGHTNYSKNNKRKYVFEVIYGKYDVEIAQLQEKRRETSSEIRRLRNYTKTVEEFLAGTPFENRAIIIHDLSNTNQDLENAFSASESLSQEIKSRTNADELHAQLLTIQQKMDQLRQELQYEQFSYNQKQSLISQLQTQSARLTKSIVAGTYLLDFDFLACPRCGSSIQPSRTSSDLCYLCLQQPEPQITQNDLLKEQVRIDQQISETTELVEAHRTAIIRIEQGISQLEAQRQQIAGEINHRSRRYVSEQAEQIAQVEQRRTQLQEQQKRLTEYLGLFDRQDHALSIIAQLESRIEELDIAIELAASRISDFDRYLNFLDSTYQMILQEIKVPSFSDPGESVIDRRTYLPIFQGRRFDELESQGLKVMVNIAHAFAHQLTSLHFELPLPNIILIDSPSGNIGYEGLDLERIEAIYSYIARVSEEYQEQLQIIIADNTVPDEVRAYVFAEFDDASKLIPITVA